MQVYDSENKRIGLVPTRFAGGSITEHIYPKKNLLIAIIAISAVLVLIVNIVVVFKIIKLRNAKEDPI
jgi:nitrogen fixation/metabolism regulation signal transduction histidine kinase